MPLGQVPHSVPFDEQVVSPTIGHKTSGRIHLPETGAEAFVCFVLGMRRHVNLRGGVSALEDVRKRGQTLSFPVGEKYGVGVEQGGLVRRADDDAFPSEIYLAHQVIKIAIFACKVKNYYGRIQEQDGGAQAQRGRYLQGTYGFGEV